MATVFVCPQPCSGLPTNPPTVITSSGAINCYTWINWNQIYSGSYNYGSATIYTSPPIVWQNWNQIYTGTGGISNQAWVVQQDPVEVERQRVEQVRLAAERQKQLVEADDRAVKTLIEHLSPVQREQYKKERVFEVYVAGKDGVQRRYRITHGWAGNVFEIDSQGRQIKKLCIHPTKTVPYADNLLAQKLLLEADEERFLKIANHTQLLVA